MPTQTLLISYGVYEGLMFSPAELLQHYLYGIDVKSRDGTALSESVLRQKLLSAQAQLSELLSLKFFREIFQQTMDFSRTDYYGWSFFKCDFPIRQPLTIEGFLGTTKQITYPLAWASFAKITDERLFARNMNLVPAGSTVSTQAQSVVFSGITPHLGFMGVDSIPNYWTIKYVTGFIKIPDSILDVVGKIAAIQILAILGDIVLTPGINSISLGIDGLSQSVSKSSGNAFSERIKQYQLDLTHQMENLKWYYKGINFAVV